MTKRIIMCKFAILLAFVCKLHASQEANADRFQDEKSRMSFSEKVAMLEQHMKQASSNQQNSAPSTQSTEPKSLDTNDKFQDEKSRMSFDDKVNMVDNLINEKKQDNSSESDKTKASQTEEPASSENDAKNEEPASSENDAKTEEPASSENDAKNEEPASSENDAKNEEPASPENDAKTEEPASSENDAKNEEPASSENDAKTEEPASSENDAKTEEPASSENDAKNEEPASPKNDTKAEEPASSENDAKTEEPASSGNDAKNEEPASPENDTKTEEPASSENDAKNEEPASSENDAKNEEPASSENDAKTEEPASSENDAKTEEPASSENDAKTEESFSSEATSNASEISLDEDDELTSASSEASEHTGHSQQTSTELSNIDDPLEDTLDDDDNFNDDPLDLNLESTDTEPSVNAPSNSNAPQTATTNETTNKTAPSVTPPTQTTNPTIPDTDADDTEETKEEPSGISSILQESFPIEETADRILSHCFRFVDQSYVVNVARCLQNCRAQIRSQIQQFEQATTLALMEETQQNLDNFDKNLTELLRHFPNVTLDEKTTRLLINDKLNILENLRTMLKSIDLDTLNKLQAAFGGYSSDEETPAAELASIADQLLTELCKIIQNLQLNLSDLVKRNARLADRIDLFHKTGSWQSSEQIDAFFSEEQNGLANLSALRQNDPNAFLLSQQDNITDLKTLVRELLDRLNTVRAPNENVMKERMEYLRDVYNKADHYNYADKLQAIEKSATLYNDLLLSSIQGGDTSSVGDKVITVQKVDELKEGVIAELLGNMMSILDTYKMRINSDPNSRRQFSDLVTLIKNKKVEYLQAANSFMKGMALTEAVGRFNQFAQENNFATPSNIPPIPTNDEMKNLEQFL